MPYEYVDVCTSVKVDEVDHHGFFQAFKASKLQWIRQSFIPCRLSCLQADLQPWMGACHCHHSLGIPNAVCVAGAHGTMWFDLATNTGCVWLRICSSPTQVIPFLPCVCFRFAFSLLSVQTQRPFNTGISPPGKVDLSLEDRELIRGIYEEQRACLAVDVDLKHLDIDRILNEHM